MSGYEGAKKIIADLYTAEDMAVVLDVMKIVNKYQSEEGRKIMESQIATLQEDGMKLVALNFYLTTLASNAEADLVKATSIRKYQYSKHWVNMKEDNPKLAQGALDQMAEVKIIEERKVEVEAQRKAKLLRSASDSATEISNMLKKVVERLLVEGTQSARYET